MVGDPAKEEGIREKVSPLTPYLSLYINPIDETLDDAHIDLEYVPNGLDVPFITNE